MFLHYQFLNWYYVLLLHFVSYLILNNQYSSLMIELFSVKKKNCINSFTHTKAIYLVNILKIVGIYFDSCMSMKYSYYTVCILFNSIFTRGQLLLNSNPVVPNHFRCADHQFCETNFVARLLNIQVKIINIHKQTSIHKLQIYYIV